jgi:hypothetical protein
VKQKPEQYGRPPVVLFVSGVMDVEILHESYEVTRWSEQDWWKDQRMRGTRAKIAFDGKRESIGLPRGTAVFM